MKINIFYYYNGILQLKYLYNLNLVFLIKLQTENYYILNIIFYGVLKLKLNIVREEDRSMFEL